MNVSLNGSIHIAQKKEEGERVSINANINVNINVGVNACTNANINVSTNGKFKSKCISDNANIRIIWDINVSQMSVRIGVSLSMSCWRSLDAE
jgi:hypothetical protein